MKSFALLFPFCLLLLPSCEGRDESDSNVNGLIDTVPPVIQLNGEAIDTAYLFTEYADPGVKLLDEKAGDLFIYQEGIVETRGKVNMRLPGSYLITYSAKDAAGNLAQAISRKVIVVENSTTYLNGNYSVTCTCTILPQGSNKPSIVSSTYSAAVLSSPNKDEFQINRLNLGPVNVMAGAHLNGSEISLDYYDRDLNYTDGSEKVYKNLLSPSKTSFTIETSVMPWSPLVTYHCKNVYTKIISITPRDE